MESKKNKWFSSWDIDGKGLTVIGNRLTGKHICNAKNEDDAAYLTKCLNAHDELVKQLDEINDFLLVLPQLRMANKDGFDDCVNIDRVIEMSRKATLLLQSIEHEIQIV